MSSQKPSDNGLNLTEESAMQNSSKRSLLIALIAFVCVGLLCVNLYAQAPDGRVSRASSNSFNRLTPFPTGSVIANSSSVLIRNENGVAYTISTTGLMPGRPYTNWWVIFNNPEFCSVPGLCALSDLPNNGGDTRVDASVLWATGRVVDASGQGNFSAHLAADGVAPGQLLFGPGLLDAFRAEIHIVVRAHGPASTNAAVLQAQLTMFNGGCPNVPPPGNLPCQDVQIAPQHLPKGGGDQK